MANKRKRDDLSDSESDDITPGRQILPVANLPYDFDQEPQDGMQYLFLVRRDARRLPRVTRVQNPYEVSETKVAPTLTPSFTNVLPCHEWKTAFQAHFSNLRKNLMQATIHVDNDQSGSRQRAIPEKKDRDAWWKFLSGCPESVWSPRKRSVRSNLNASSRTQPFIGSAEVTHLRNMTVLPDVSSGNEASHLPIASFDDLDALRHPSSLDNFQVADSANSASFTLGRSMLSDKVGKELIEQLSPPEVTPSHLREIDHRMSMHLLMYFAHWINIHLRDPSDPLTTISTYHGQWIFALLTKVEDRLSADEMNLLRNLARACVELLRSKHAKHTAAPGMRSSPTLVEDTTHISDASCWMIFAAIAGYWGQRDLWADAETTLVSV